MTPGIGFVEISIHILVENIIAEIKEQYLADDTPWIIGFSGGKDSTTLLQLVFYSLLELQSENVPLHKEIHVLCNDTLVENPAVARWIDDTLDKIRVAGKDYGFPIKVVKVTPILGDTFWINLIGKGYPSPNRFFRWCTERMKINPTNKYIKDTLGDNGEAILLLGTRKAESTNRRASMARPRSQIFAASQISTSRCFRFRPDCRFNRRPRLDVSFAGSKPLARRQPQTFHALPQCFGRRMSAGH